MNFWSRLLGKGPSTGARPTRNLYEIAARYTGIREIPGEEDNPLILAMLKLDSKGKFGGWPDHDEVPWCSAFVNFVCWTFGLRHAALNARSWETQGRKVNLSEARQGDVVVLWRGSPSSASGHVGFYHNHDSKYVYILGGNQQNTVNVSRFPKTRVVAVRRVD